MKELLEVEGLAFGFLVLREDMEKGEFVVHFKDVFEETNKPSYWGGSYFPYSVSPDSRKRALLNALEEFKRRA